MSIYISDLHRRGLGETHTISPFLKGSEVLIALTFL